MDLRTKRTECTEGKKHITSTAKKLHLMTAVYIELQSRSRHFGAILNIYYTLGYCCRSHRIIGHFFSK